MITIATAVSLATHYAFATTSPTIVVNPCPVNTVWLGGNTCQLVNNYYNGGGYGSDFDHGSHR
jgi:hypothetical protein